MILDGHQRDMRPRDELAEEPGILDTRPPAVCGQEQARLFVLLGQDLPDLHGCWHELTSARYATGPSRPCAACHDRRVSGIPRIEYGPRLLIQTMNPLKSGAASLVLAFGVTVAHGQTDAQPLHLEIMKTCKDGLVVWLPLRQVATCGQVQTPQVKIFDGNGRLRFVGTGMATLQWAKSGMPGTPIPAGVTARDAVSEARLTHASAPVSGHGWITYYTTKPCPPCIEQLAALRRDVLPKLGVETEITVFDMY